jgi:hypothetical protein
MNKFVAFVIICLRKGAMIASEEAYSTEGLRQSAFVEKLVSDPSQLPPHGYVRRLTGKDLV